MGAPVVELQRRGDAQVIVARTAPELQGSIRGLAWFLVVVGVTGLAGLAVLRVPASVHLAYLVFFVLTAVVVWADAQEGGARVTGELGYANGRLTRMTGFSALGWSELVLPARGVIVLETIAELDTKRLVGEMERACRVIAVPTEDAVATWEAVRFVRKAPIGLTVVPQASFDVARGIAEALSEALTWDMIDLTADPERRGSDELDRPLADRAEALAKAIATDVPAGRPFGASRWTDATGTHLGLRSIGPFGLVGQLALAVPLLALVYLLSGGNLGIPLLGAALVLFRFGGRTIVDLRPDQLVVRPLTLWLPLDDETTLSWTQVEGVQAVTDRGSVGLRIVADDGSVFLPTSSRAAARWAAQEIKRYLAERARPR